MEMAQELEEALTDRLVESIVQILWDEKPRTSIEIAKELQFKFPLQFFEAHTDALARTVYAWVLRPLVIEGMIALHEGHPMRYSISVAIKIKRGVEVD